MLKHLCLAAALALQVSAAVAQDAPTPGQVSPDADSDTGHRIVGGKDAAPGSAPWQAEIRILPTWPTTEPGNHKQGEAKFSRVQLSQAPPGVWQHWCGASYIAPNWILTAAHCVTEKDQKRQGLQVQIGVQNLADAGRLYPIARIYSHKDYDPGGDTGQPVNDIALVHLAPTAISGPSSVTVRAIPVQGVARGSRPLKADDVVTVTGWGRATAVDPNANRRAGAPVRAFVDQTLQEVQLVIVDTSSCIATWGKDAKTGKPLVAAGTVCATGTTPGKDACDGDSGGPMTRGAPNPRYDSKGPRDPKVNPPYRAVLVGVVSWGADKCGAAPGVYTDVAAFVDWIKTTMGGDARLLSR